MLKVVKILAMKVYYLTDILQESEFLWNYLPKPTSENRDRDVWICLYYNNHDQIEPRSRL